VPTSPKVGASSGPEDLDLNACVELSRDLAARVRESGFSPTLVIGIREGGALPAMAVARELGARVELILVQRAGSGFRHTRLGRLAARLLAGPYKRWYWVRRLAESVNRGGGHKVASIPTNSKLRGERILVVDDFSSSGRTLQRTSEALAGQGAAAIKTAVLTFLPGREPVQQAPDLSVCQKWLTFSWSTHSPHYPDFQRWMREQATPGPG
jgi:hypoxanthine phosphoribosyltransferase